MYLVFPIYVTIQYTIQDNAVITETVRKKIKGEGKTKQKKIS